MKPAHHAALLAQMVAVWVAFWLAGWPDYYQQYPTESVAIACILLSVAISLAALYLLLRGREDRRMSRAFWLSVYYTLPFAVLDTLYCGIYLGHGASYLVRYWYLTVFYFTPWITLIPTALLLKSRVSDQSTGVSS